MIKQIWNPLLRQGKEGQKNFFEGWYYKQVTGDGAQVISFIPGYSLAPKKEHAFIQYIIGGPSGTRSGYVSFPIDQLKIQDSPFEVSIGESKFWADGFSLDFLDHQEGLSFRGKLRFGSFRELKKSLYCPGIMGPFAYLPGMECNHGVLSLDHSLSGQLQIGDKHISFDGGRGYLEKDWGRSFPKAYRWLQCNHFDAQAALFFSEASIPVGPFSFPGYIGVLELEGVEHRFATYTRGYCRSVVNESGELKVELDNGKMLLTLSATPGESRRLLAPVLGTMTKVIKEDISARVTLALTNKKTGESRKLKGYAGGLELVEAKE